MSGALTPDTVSLDREHALALDAADELAPYRRRFAFPTQEGGSPVVYLLANSLGLMPDTARAAVEDEMRRWGALAIDGWFRGSPSWYEYHDSFRDAAARVVGAQSHEVVMMNTLTMNLHAMMISFYRPAGSRTKILMEENAFPSDRYAVASQVRMR
jgi:kynureninase